jgi:glutaredoxin
MHASLIVRALVFAAVASGLAAQAQSTLHRWVDKDGRVHFTDTPPPPDARSATQKRFGQAADEQPLPFATQTAMLRHPVMLWVAPQCEPCSQGRELLSRRGVPFSERDVQANVETQAAFRKITGDLNVPVIEIGTSRIKGFEEGQWNAALDSAGYPKERPYGQPPSRPTIANLPAAPKEAGAAAAPSQPQ